MSLELSASSAAQYIYNSTTLLQTPQDLVHTDNTDEDDDDGVPISHLLNAQNVPLEVGFAQQQAAPSLTNLPHVEAMSGTTSTPISIHNQSTNTPTVISQLSQQLTQIQEAQGTDLGAEMLGYIGSVHHNSNPPTLPLLSPPIPPPSAGDGEEEVYTSSDNAAVSIATSPTAIAISQMYPPSMAEIHNATAPDTLPPFAHWHSLDGIFQNVDFGISEVVSLNNADMVQVEVDQNSYTLSMYDFLWTWGHRSPRTHFGNKKKAQCPNLGSLQRQRIAAPKQVHRRDLQGDQCDIQGMNWLDMDVTRQEARRARVASYKNYESIPAHSHSSNEAKKNASVPPLPHVESYLRFRQMNLQHKPLLSHFQLRNLIACTSRSNIFFAGKHKVHCANPLMGTSSTVIDLTDPDSHLTTLYSFYNGVQISTIAAKHDILLAGGFNGEYGMINLRSSKDSDHIGGLVTDSLNSITNHISLSLSRSSGLPQAAFASNDNGVRLLDCTTNKILTTHSYSFPVNCTAISPDSRLRVIVGDTTTVHICDSGTGTTLQELEGHSDFGFACDWADNGWHVATGNQDMTVKIWDARMWNDRHGNANPLKTIRSELAGVRSLQFSPLGSGKRILLACEAADVIDVIDAESYDSKQIFDFFGEIGGACFTPDGQDVFVANCDNLRGGILEFERTGEGGRMNYRTSRTDVEEINQDLSRRKNQDWLNDERDSDRHPNHRFKSRIPEEVRIPGQGAPDQTGTVTANCVVDWKPSIEAPIDSVQTTPVMRKLEERKGPQRSPRHSLPHKQQSNNHTTTPSSWAQPEEIALAEAFGTPDRSKPKTTQVYESQQEIMDWNADGEDSIASTDDEEDVLGSDDEGYTSIEEKVRKQARGYDWRQTDAEAIADSGSSGRTMSWHRSKHLFADGGMEPLLGGGEMGIDVGL